METKRDSFIFYRSFMEALSELNDEQYAKVFRAITKFALDGKEIKLTGIEKVIFQLIKPQLIANQKRYDNGCKGGRKSTKTEPNDNQNETENKPNDNQTESKPKPNENDNVNDNENVNDNYNYNKQASKYININNNNAYACKDYAEVMDEFCVSSLVKPYLWEFIKHCQINGRKLTNDKLEGIIVELDKQDTEIDQIDLLKDAINGGYYDIRR